MSKIDEAKAKAGELFMIGFEGKTLSDDTSAFLSQARIGGVILFQHNYETPEQVAALINEIQECRTDLPLWVAVDQEGGRVQRFKKPFTILPTAQQVGAKSSPKTAFEVAQIQAKELKAVGVNVNFAPVADILTNPKNPVIGDRSFGSDEETVSKMVTASVRGMVTGGVQPCLKHFPGHGDTEKDSHFELPTVNVDLETLKNREFRPFVKAAKSRCAMIMTAHILNRSIDPEFPATLSKKFIRDILRSELRFSRIVISDDMDMKAIADNFGVEKAAILALQAGCDILLYRSEGTARRAYEAVLKAIESEELSAEEILASVERSQSTKKESLSDYAPNQFSTITQIVGSPEHQKMLDSLLK